MLAMTQVGYPLLTSKKHVEIDLFSVAFTLKNCIEHPISAHSLPLLADVSCE